MYKDYFIFNTDMAVRRGIGQCGQQGQVLSNELNDVGINAYTIGLSGHVIVGMEYNGKEVMLDPDYDVYLEMTLDSASVKRDYIFSRYEHINNLYSDTSKYYISASDMLGLYVSAADNWRSDDNRSTIYKVPRFSSSHLKHIGCFVVI